LHISRVLMFGLFLFLPLARKSRSFIKKKVNTLVGVGKASGKRRAMSVENGKQ